MIVRIGDKVKAKLDLNTVGDFGMILKTHAKKDDKLIVTEIKRGFYIVVKKENSNCEFVVHLSEIEEL